MTPAFLLDTHAAVWLLEGDSRLGAKALAALQTEEAMAISDITLLEIAMLVDRGVVELQPDAATGLQKFADKFVVLPITAQIAVDATKLNLPHRDPFDRVIAATALAHNLTLVTKDRQITEAKVVATLW